MSYADPIDRGVYFKRSYAHRPRPWHARYEPEPGKRSGAYFATSVRAYAWRLERVQEHSELGLKRGGRGDGKEFSYILRDPCAYCGSFNDITFDHIDARGDGTYRNLTAACRSCNASKKGKPLLLFLAHRNGCWQWRHDALSA